MFKHLILIVNIFLLTIMTTNILLSQSPSKSKRHSLSQAERMIFDQASRLSEEGVFNEAARVWKELVDEYPDCGNYRYHYAVCLLHSGDPVASIDKLLYNSISSSGS